MDTNWTKIERKKQNPIKDALFQIFRRRNAVERGAHELAALAYQMELVDVQAAFTTLQVELRKSRDIAVANRDFKRADQLESALLGVLRARAEITL